MSELPSIDEEVRQTHRPPPGSSHRPSNRRVGGPASG